MQPEIVREIGSVNRRKGIWDKKFDLKILGMRPLIKKILKNS